jgi:hypothetical protein
MPPSLGEVGSHLNLILLLFLPSVVLEMEWNDLGDPQRLHDVVGQLQQEGAYDAISREFVRYPAIDHIIRTHHACSSVVPEGRCHMLLEYDRISGFWDLCL